MRVNASGRSIRPRSSADDVRADDGLLGAVALAELSDAVEIGH
jgi:hypothetical protein